MELRYLLSAHTDIGIKKKTNQDSVLAMKARFDNDEIVFAVLCDGMGGLAKGEVASASVVEAFGGWFENDFAEMLKSGFSKDEVFKAWETIASGMNSKIASYGAESSISLGTTLVMMLIYRSRYYIMNIGDSRAYKFSNHTSVLTKDHTFVSGMDQKG